MKFDFFNFNKPGPGVPDVEPDMPRWKRFFAQFASKMVQILGLNFLYLLFSIPSLILAYFASFWVIGKSFDSFYKFTWQNNGLEMITPRLILGMLMVLVPAVAIGPVQAGFTYVLRNFSRQRHAYVWWDFKDHAKANFKQGMIVTVINLVIVFLLGLAINSYIQFSPQFQGIISYAAIGFISLAFAVFLSMNFFIYPLMVTYDMKITQLYKVAYSFAFLKLIPNLLLLLGISVILVLAYSIILPIGLILTGVILPAGILFLINFYVDPIIRKFDEEQEAQEAQETQETI